MALNIKNQDAETVLNSVLKLNTFLDEEIWSQIPAELLGTTLSKAEEEQILGLGKLGV